MELYASENNFNIFYEKKRRELRNLQQLNEFVKPNPYFVYFMFKDTIHVDDYGSIKETLFKFPSMTRVSSIGHIYFSKEKTGQVFLATIIVVFINVSVFLAILGISEPSTAHLSIR